MCTDVTRGTLYWRRKLLSIYQSSAELTDPSSVWCYMDWKSQDQLTPDQVLGSQDEIVGKGWKCYGLILFNGFFLLQ